MKKIIKKIDESFEENEIMKISRQLNQTYYAYMLDAQVWNLLYSVFPKSFKENLDNIRVEELGHNIVNEIIMRFYPCERIIKYNLVKDFRKHSDEVTIFEMKVKNSRIDIGRINGSSYVYEIKTELDSLNKLEKQLRDYSEVFEYINIVIHPKHLKRCKNIIPEFCGIITYETNPKECKFINVKKAKKNPLINSCTQIQTLTSKDLEYIIRKYIDVPIPNKRSDREELILSKYNNKKINLLFKEAIKQRYFKRWNFICSFFDNINPIDIQELYTGPIDLSLIYGNNS